MTDEEGRRVVGIGSNLESSGRALYHRWLGSATSDEAHYYDFMNPADKARWEALGRELDQQDIGHNFAIQKRIEAVAEHDALAARVLGLQGMRYDLRLEAGKLLWDKRSMLPEQSDEIVDDVLTVVFDLIAREFGNEGGPR